MITIKRVYQNYEPSDGFRVLIDRLWPRGISKEKAKIDLWLKDIAPSNELRKWFNHEPAKWDEFVKRYHQELDSKSNLIEDLKRLTSQHNTLTLLYSAADEKLNNAVALIKYLESSK
ncbi:DUF488 domain-containing protein [Candidatus Saccharibacteria bacterium]|jgi:uncharacterized protein YeaO (DUF488 family)|nr:DUF488 domain-containing protein [Candidatus Saccharibacteria bacterium]